MEDTICKCPWKFSVEEISMVMEREFEVRNFYEWEIAVFEIPFSQNKDCYGIVGKFAEG